MVIMISDDQDMTRCGGMETGRISVNRTHTDEKNAYMQPEYASKI